MSVKNTFTPSFDEEISFNISNSELANASIVVALCRDTFLKNSDVMARVVLRHDSSDADVRAQWADMLAGRKRSRWHLLSD